MPTQGHKRGSDDPSTSNDQSRECNKRLCAIAKGTAATPTLEMDVIKVAKEGIGKVLSRLDKVSPPFANMDFIGYLREKISALDAIIDDKVVVGVFGRSGAGKSSLMNAILGVKTLLPSGTVGACTSVIIQVEANMTDSNYVAEIHFISKEEWEKELESLLKIKEIDGEEKDKRMVNMSNSKIQALYGEDAVGKSFDELKSLESETFSDIPEFFSSTRKILSFDTATKFSTEIACYIRSKRKIHGKQYKSSQIHYWPLVKYVTIKMPNSKDLLEHIVLVDLPGTGDCNKARDEMWESYITKCSSVWVVADIDRAAADRDAWNMLDNSISNMGPGGQCQNITFICTKTDDINPDNYMLEMDDEDLHIENSSNDSEEQKRACILHRNQQAKMEIQENYSNPYEAIDEMQVFTVSSQEFQKDNNCILRQEETEIPELRALLKSLNDQRSEKVMRDYVIGAYGILSMVHVVNHGITKSMETEKKKLHKLLEQRLEDELQNIDQFMSDIHMEFDKCLSAGVLESEKTCVTRAKEEVIAPKGKGGGGYHQTLRAVCNGQGFCRSTNGVKTNMNASLSSSLCDAIKNMFSKTFKKSQKSISAKIDNFSILLERHDEETMFPRLAFLKTEEHKLKADLKHEIVQRKKEIYSSLVKSIMTSMLPSYTEASNVHGKGSLKRMQDILESHIESSKSTMFHDAKGKMLTLLTKLSEYIVQEIRSKLKEAMKQSLHNELPLPDISEHYEIVKSAYEKMMGKPITDVEDEKCLLEDTSGKEMTSEQVTTKIKVPLRNNRNDEKKKKKKKKKKQRKREKDVLADAVFVDKHMSALIKRAAMVMAIADDLLGEDMIQDETYSDIEAAETSEKKMRVLYKALRSGGPMIKSAFYTALQTNEPNLVKDLASP
ncbi:nuclear GTPase SLIP-GC-like isoform X1 [Salvelinus fontinalis]|uniref:nuclear GTPase SLIP-GC-like isoform X1 n=1 Tax=Salvelinus fontinalis TaxID=8038 RepID=UPI00248666E6|nr:nuclear GTPase SLIP-GC-like isoform X1 [Salvelinus fontinalis]XP_055754355.1 nuclear GTPase SLIP-GC-like isoform X1 [Salvelinus fontinalis]XP_055754356.1 nuclear GTPase SLIP-GC-like isoform X1 [Salvelinus fontinalis]